MSSDYSYEKLKQEYQEVKPILKAAVNTLKDKKIPLQLTSVLKHVYSTATICHNMPSQIRKLLLQIITVGVSEAVCETWGSIMERYHERFTHSDIDDKQLQTEMFVHLIGPPVGRCLNFVKKCVKKHGKSFLLQNDRSRYIGIGKVIDRMRKEKYKYPFQFQ